MKIVFSPLPGTGNKPVREGLKAFSFRNVIVVNERELPDPNFPPVKSPNPEEDADILMATNPDADRLGVALSDLHGNM